MKPVPLPSDELEALVAERTAELLRTQEQLESRIRERTAELDRFFTLSLDMLCIAGFDGYFKRLNPAWCKLLGWSQAEMLSRPYVDFIHPDDRERTLAQAGRLLEGSLVLSFENRYRCKDGTCKWLVWTATPLESHQLIYAVARDITERKEAEGRLATQHATLAVLTEAANLHEAASQILPIICEGLGWDVGGLWVPESALGCLVLVEAWQRPTRASPRFGEQTRRLSFPPGVGLPGRVWATAEPLWVPDVCREEDFLRADAANSEGLHSAIAFPIQLDNEVLGVLEFFSRDIRPPDEELLRMFATLSGQIGQFIERKRSESALAERARLAALGADVGLALTQEKQVPALLRRCVAAVVRHLDAVFARAWVCNAAEAVLELQASAGLYTRTDGTFHRVPLDSPRKLACIVRDRQPLLSNQIADEPFLLDKEWARREGLVAFAGYPLMVDEEVLGVLALFARQPLSKATYGALAALSHSIALGMKRIFAEEEMRRAKESAEEANRSKSDFLAKMSHELRTPLNSVIGFANVLLKNKGKNLREQDLTFLERILDNGKHLLSLINHILDLSKVEAGRMELDLAPVSLDTLIREVLDQIRGQVQGRSVRLVTDLPGTMAPLHTDSGKLKQVLINLIGNALKFTERGAVTVRVRTDAAHRPEAIEVTDTGIGIAPDRLHAIFEAFQQADNSTTRRYGGTGLGLTISRSLCQLLGYCLEVESTPGQGSTFRIRLDQAAPALLAAPPPAADSLLSGKRVLIIDDEPDSRLLLSSYLSAEGAELRLVGDGREALALLEVFVPDLVLLDLMMPGVDGLAFLEKLRSDPRFVHLPVMVVTVKDLSAEEERRLASQTLGIINKGADLEGALKRVLRQALPEPGSTGPHSTGVWRRPQIG